MALISQHCNFLSNFLEKVQKKGRKEIISSIWNTYIWGEIATDRRAGSSGKRCDINLYRNEYGLNRGYYLFMSQSTKTRMLLAISGLKRKTFYIQDKCFSCCIQCVAWTFSSHRRASRSCSSPSLHLLFEALAFAATGGGVGGHFRAGGFRGCLPSQRMGARWNGGLEMQYWDKMMSSLNSV